MVKSMCSKIHVYFNDEGARSDACFSAKNVWEHVGDNEKVIDKVHSIHKSLVILVSRYNSELNDLHDTISNFSEFLKGTHVKNSNLDDSLSRITFKNEERRLKIEALKIAFVRLHDDVMIFKRDNRTMLK